jgi:hypothetical protein
MDDYHCAWKCEEEWKLFRKCGHSVAFINKNTGEIRFNNEYNEIECFDRQKRRILRDSVSDEILNK